MSSIELEELLNRAQFEASDVLKESDDLLSSCTDQATMSTLHRVQALAHRSLGDPAAALTSANLALEIAESSPERDLVAQAKMTKAPFVAMSGALREAFELLEDAAPVLRGSDRALVETQKGGILGMIADNAGANEAFGSAVDLLEHLEKPELLATGLLGRGVVRAFLGEVEEGRLDLDRALSIYTEHDDLRGIAEASHNLAIVSLNAGDPARAVVEFEEAANRWRDAEAPLEHYRSEYCEALLEAGLATQAAEIGEEATRALEQAGDELTTAAQQLIFARSLLEAGHRQRGRQELANACELMESHGQRGRAAFAELALLRQDIDDGRPSSTVIKQLAVLATQLKPSGNIEWQTEAELIATRAEIVDVQLQSALRRLMRLKPAQGTFAQQVERLELLATIASSNGDGSAALRHCRRAIHLVNAANRLGGSALLRGSMTKHHGRVLSIGLSQLLRAGRSRDALKLVELATPRNDAAVARSGSAKFIERRSLSRALAGGLPPSERSRVQTRLRALDAEVRSESSQLLDQLRRTEAQIPTDTTIVRYVALDDSTWAIKLHKNRARSTEVSTLDGVRELSGELLHYLRRDLLDAKGASPTLAEVADELDEMLGRPGELVRKYLGTLHIAPAVQLPQIPFALLPSMAGVPWLQIERCTLDEPAEHSIPEGQLLVSGKGLEFGDTEVDAVSARYPEATKLAGDDATCETVIASMNNRSLVHIAAHSQINPNNVMFSSISMADGDLYLHELEGIEHPPSLVILASCESARTEAVGTAAVGLATGLLAGGIDTVIGTVCEIPDDRNTATVMQRLHAGLVGSTPVKAIQAVSQIDSLTPAEMLISQCLVPMRTHPLSEG